VSPLLETLQLGRTPRVVGTIITQEYLDAWPNAPRKPPCHLVELRVDGFPASTNWVDIGESIENYELPVFATIRLAREGGKWTGLDSDRWPLIEESLRRLSGVDVEIESELGDLASRLANELNKLCVLSYHNFQNTPPLENMRDLLKRAHAKGAIGKIAATVNTPEDLAAMRSLLSETWPLPICLIGMGPLGRESRLEFPRLGSCLTYGYLDSAGAPGQFPAAELMSRFAQPGDGSGV
jgi:3-dehydroquinate dehydratase I